MTCVVLTHQMLSTLWYRPETPPPKPRHDEIELKDSALGFQLSGSRNRCPEGQKGGFAPTIRESDRSTQAELNTCDLRVFLMRVFRASWAKR